MAASFADACTLLSTPKTEPVCYGIEDVEKTFGVTFTPDELSALSTVPFSEDVLRASAGTHMLLPSAPMSLLDIRTKHRALFLSETGGWYAEERQSFSQSAIPVRWNLLRLTPVPGSNRKTWQEQLALLDDTEEMPSAALIALAAVLYYRKTGQQLYERCIIRTADGTAAGSRIGFHWYDGRLRVFIIGWDGYRRDGVWAVASRLPEPCTSNP